MPTIYAQKLCREIVEPRVIPSEDSVKKRPSGKFVNSSNRYNTKLPRIGYTARSKISKIEPTHTSYSLKGLKSGVNILKSKIADSAVNTLVSGPLRCDKNCVTSIRKHNHQGTCKCGNNKKPKVNAKEIQTLSKIIYSLSDRACTQLVETASCGTQFFDNRGRMLQNSKIPIKLQEQYSKYDPDFEKYIKKGSSTNQYGGSLICKPNLRYICSKRWALTNYPTRGPDF